MDMVPGRRSCSVSQGWTFSSPIPSHLKLEFMKNKKRDSPGPWITKSKLPSKHWWCCDLRGGREPSNMVYFGQREYSAALKGMSWGIQKIRVQVPLLLLASHVTLSFFSVTWRWQMVPSSRDCWFKWDHVCEALSRVPGTSEASINARLATAIKLPPLLLLFQDTTAAACHDSLLHSACPASALLRNGRAPRRITRIILLATTVSPAPQPRVLCQDKAFMEETRQEDNRFVPLKKKKKKSNRSTLTKITGSHLC